MLFAEKYDKVPYEVLNYLGAIVNYGGRVTDDKDSLLISTILKTFICDEAIQVGHKFSKSGIYNVIEPGEKEDYLDYIKKLPLNPSPEAFSLHENAEITTYINETILLMENVLSMQPKAGGGGKGKSREEIIGEQAKSLQERAPPPFSLEKVLKLYPTSYEESMNTVLFQECVRYNKLLFDMGSMLKLV
jgi:dynein heavy chain